MPRTSYPAGRPGLPALAQGSARAARRASSAWCWATRATTSATIARVQAIVRKDGLAARGRRPTTYRCSKTRCAWCSSRRNSSTSRPGSIPDKLPGVITKTAREDERGRTRRDRGRAARSGRAPAARRSVRPRRRAALPRRVWPRATGTRSRPRSRPTSNASVRIATCSTVARDYAEFLRDDDHRLSVGLRARGRRLIVDGNRVAVELNETVDDGDARLHTDETVVFDVARRSHRTGRRVSADVGAPGVAGPA